MLWRHRLSVTTNVTFSATDNTASLCKLPHRALALCVSLACLLASPSRHHCPSHSHSYSFPTNLSLPHSLQALASHVTSSSFTVPYYGVPDP
ncbi:hypothetical protein E2C01_097430 [Portunus trituberculatus]|uniref:Uncharacterized protein n=1 Tax=Portunus trituberculatus TaxID=210409 RepID=A0A5B7JV58_PORTR|nr:hypothetical protein [Portunus trituberculatus]